MKFIVFSVLLMFSYWANSGQIYHCKTSNGKIEFQDKPCKDLTLKVENDSAETTKPSGEELEKVTAVQMAMLGSGFDAAIKFGLENPGVSPPGCFDMDSKLVPYGRDVFIEGVQLRCMKASVGGIETGSFQSILILTYCKNNPQDVDCADLDEELREDYFKQL